MPDPLVTDPKSVEAVKSYIDSRIGDYQWQRRRAQKSGDRYGDRIGAILQDELLDLRNRICGVPGSSGSTRERTRRVETQGPSSSPFSDKPLDDCG